MLALRFLTWYYIYDLAFQNVFCCISITKIVCFIENVGFEVGFVIKKLNEGGSNLTMAKGGGENSPPQYGPW